MCGAGKSTVGVILAKIIGAKFIDTDIIIQSAENKSLQSLIDDAGLENFCQLEEKYILDINTENTVIATGGSVVYSPKAMAHLKSIGQVIHLDLDFETIQKRVTNLYTRGVVMAANQTLNDLFEKRQPLYQKYADLTINCVNQNQQQIAEQIIALLN